MSYESKDTLVLGAQLEVQSLMIRADLEALTSDHPSVVSFDATDVAGTDATVAVEIQEPIAKVIKARIYDNKLQAAQVAVATFSGSVITFANINTSAVDLADCVVEVHYVIE